MARPQPQPQQPTKPERSAPPPTVARMVHYYPAGAGGPWAALVTETGAENAALEGDAVALQVFHASAARHVEAVPYSAAPAPGHWTWPPKV